MDKGERLSKFRVEAQGSGHCASNLRNLKRVGEPITKMIGIADGEDLRFGLQPAKRARMNHPIPVALERVAIGVI